MATSLAAHACKLQISRCLTYSKQQAEFSNISPSEEYPISTTAYNPPLSRNPQQNTVHHIMGYHNTTRRKSSFHFTAEAYLAFGIGLARRVSRTERRSSYAETRSSKSKSTSSNTSSSSSSSRNTKRASSPSRRPSKPAKSYPCYHRIVTPEPSPQYQHQTDSLHNFCLASDATYARLTARLERLHEHEEDVTAYVRDMGVRSGLGRVAEGLREEVGRLEEVLGGMRRKIEEGEGGWDGSGEAFLVGGRWATFL